MPKMMDLTSQHLDDVFDKAEFYNRMIDLDGGLVHAKDPPAGLPAAAGRPESVNSCQPPDLLASACLSGGAVATARFHHRHPDGLIHLFSIDRSPGRRSGYSQRLVFRRYSSYFSPKTRAR